MLYPQTKKDMWKIIDGRTILMSPNSAEDAKKFLTLEPLPSIFAEYIKNPRMLYRPDLRNVNILTGTNEILATDTQGRIFRKDEKIIINTHGLNFGTDNALTDTQLSELLEGIVEGEPKKVNVYTESDMKKIGKTKIVYPCISVIKGEKYLRDPSPYCNDLEHLTVEGNYLLISRTMKSSSELANFIENASYFSQSYPLIEPLLLSRPQNLFKKYSNRIIPLILSDGEIIKEANDSPDYFDDNKQRRNSSELLVAVRIHSYNN